VVFTVLFQQLTLQQATTDVIEVEPMLSGMVSHDPPPPRGRDARHDRGGTIIQTLVSGAERLRDLYAVPSLHCSSVSRYRLTRQMPS